MTTQRRREFLKNSLKFGAVAGASLVAAKSVLANEQGADTAGLKGKRKKQERLYEPSKSWQNYYEIAH